MAEKTTEARNIGINVIPPKETCTDQFCPFHGKLSLRGQIITGVASTTKMQHTIIVKREYMQHVPKYERYEKRTSLYAAHCPPCLEIQQGDKVRIVECRPLSKTVSFVAIEKI
ncbi:MAG: 30S ribosomal protein S17 [Candidatus Thermoplasmatota archaeon]|nr:30S ribosomal protein S17 [Candidatus Thermoplasmatota archaeon]